jgi:hypothetical protein
MVGEIRRRALRQGRSGQSRRAGRKNNAENATKAGDEGKPSHHAEISPPDAVYRMGIAQIGD